MNTKSIISVGRVLLWLVVAGFMVLSVVFGIMVGRLFYLDHHPELWPPDSFSPLWCANTVTDPLQRLLNICAPLAAVAGVALIYFAHRGHGSRCSTWFGEILVVCLTGVLVCFGFWFFQMMPPLHFADLIWWMIRL